MANPKRAARPWYVLPLLLGVVMILAALFMRSDLRAYYSDLVLGIPLEVTPKISSTLAEMLQAEFGVSRDRWTSSYQPLGNGHVRYTVRIWPSTQTRFADPEVQARLERVFQAYFRYFTADDLLLTVEDATHRTLFWVYADRATQQAASRSRVPLRSRWLADASGLTSEPLSRSVQAQTSAFRDELAEALRTAGLQVQSCVYTYLCASSTQSLAVVAARLDRALANPETFRLRPAPSLLEDLQAAEQRLRSMGMVPGTSEWDLNLTLTLSRTFCLTSTATAASLFLKPRDGRVEARVSAIPTDACPAGAF